MLYRVTCGNGDMDLLTYALLTMLLDRGGWSASHLAALPLSKEPTVTIEQESDWISEPVLAFGRTKYCNTPARY